MSELVDDRDSKSRELTVVGVRFPPRPLMSKKERLAYLIGVALGDGNLSNPNGRAVRLRITCDARYPAIAKEIIENIKILLPKNKVGIVPSRTQTYFNISVYSNMLNNWMPWHVGQGSKLQQFVHVPEWIKINKIYTRACLRGLLQTDGSIYSDRGYIMVNFSNHSRPLAHDVHDMIMSIGFLPTITKTGDVGHIKYTVRLARSTTMFIKHIHLQKQ